MSQSSNIVVWHITDDAMSVSQYFMSNYIFKLNQKKKNDSMEF